MHVNEGIYVSAIIRLDKGHVSGDTKGYTTGVPNKDSIIQSEWCPRKSSSTYRYGYIQCPWLCFIVRMYIHTHGALYLLTYLYLFSLVKQSLYNGSNNTTKRIS